MIYWHMIVFDEKSMLEWTLLALTIKLSLNVYVCVLYAIMDHQNAHYSYCMKIELHEWIILVLIHEEFSLKTKCIINQIIDYSNERRSPKCWITSGNDINQNRMHFEKNESFYTIRRFFIKRSLWTVTNNKHYR